jgi:MFS family permease
VGGIAFALFNSSMFAGRMVNAPFVARYGARISLLLSGALSIAAMVLLMLAGNVPLAITGLLLLGIAVAGPIPTALSVAAKIAPGNSATIAGAMMAGAYAAFIVCPPTMGYVADLFSLRTSFVLIGLAGLAILWLGNGINDT